MKLKVNIPMNGKKEGDIVVVKTKGGIIIDKFWRKRLQDSKLDNCVSIVKTKKVDK